MYLSGSLETMKQKLDVDNVAFINNNYRNIKINKKSVKKITEITCLDFKNYVSINKYMKNQSN